MMGKAQWLFRGIYVPDTDAFPTHFRGLGIRIEDSVCVEEEHPYVLTTEAVKEVSRSSSGAFGEDQSICV